MDVGPVVTAARRARGWTQRDLAAHAGLTEAAVRQIERGRRNPSLRTLERVLGAMGLRGELRVHRLRERTAIRLTREERQAELERWFPFTLVSTLLDLEVRFAVDGRLALLLQGFAVPLGEAALVLWDDDENLARTVTALRAVGGGPVGEEELMLGHDELFAIAFGSMTLGPREIRAQQNGWWMCQEADRLRLGVDPDDPQQDAVSVLVTVWEDQLTVPVRPVHVVTRDDPGLAAVVGSGAWNTPT